MNHVGMHLPATFMGCCGLTIGSVVVLSVVASLFPYSGAQQVKSACTLHLLVRDYTFKSYNRNFIKKGSVHSVSLPQNLYGEVPLWEPPALWRSPQGVPYGCRGERNAVSGESHGYPAIPETELVDCVLLQLRSIQLPADLARFGTPSDIPISDTMRMPVDIPSAPKFAHSSLIPGPLTEAIARQYQRPGIELLCANFGADGKLTLSNLVALAPYLFLALESGHFGLVMELPSVQGRKKESMWKAAIGRSIGTALGVLLLGLLMVALFVKAKKRSRREEMERKAYKEEALQVSIVGHVKAPTAAITRTVPGIEHGYVPSPP